MAPTHRGAPTVTGDGLKARRHAREIVAELRWCGMTVPSLYARMAGEFEDLVRSGDYAARVAANQTPALLGRKLHVAGHPGPVRLDRSGAAPATPGARRTSARRIPGRGPLPGPAPGR
jgi:hypothetical protein